MRRIRYAVAASLDGYIAGPHGEADWIVPSPAIDLSDAFSEFDPALIGRYTYEVMLIAGQQSMPGMKAFVFPRILRPITRR
jgi:dihydrofolate reductase